MRQSRLQAALISAWAAVALSGVGIAAEQMEKKDKDQVVPSKIEPGRPSLDKLDENVQRQHDRDSGVAGPAKDKVGAPVGATGAAGRGAEDAKGRDWSAIDKNNDNLIEPEEMETWLKANPGPLAKKSG